MKKLNKQASGMELSQPIAARGNKPAYSSEQPKHAEPREDLAFCLPLTISLVHRDYCWVLLVALHVATLIVLLRLPLQVLGCAAFAIACSLKLYRERQSRLLPWTELRCDQNGQWWLTDMSANTEWTRLKGMRVIGRVCLIEMRRFGNPVFWVTLRRHQSEVCWTRLRVLNQLL